MLKPNDPLVLTIPGSTSVSLKNGRMLTQQIIKGKRRTRLIVAPAVRQAMNRINSAITRQCAEQSQNQWNLIADDGIAVVLETHTFYRSKFPRSDVDNFYTTFQECLQDRVIANDNQVEYFLPFRCRANRKEHEFAKAFIWTTNGFQIEEMEEFLVYYKEVKKNESERFQSVTGLIERATPELGTVEAIDIF